MKEIRLHGRGGQGVVLSARILASAAILEGKNAQAFPNFGPERRGAPVVAYCRISDDPIITREPILNPDIIVVHDPLLLRTVLVGNGLKSGGKVILNSCFSPEEASRRYGFKDCILVTVDANEISQRILGVTITNTAMLGALLKAEPFVSQDSLVEEIKKALGRVADKNVKAFMEAYAQARMAEIVAT
jgi:pyruvate ferredoxin oxidoreductase gamma subunit